MRFPLIAQADLSLEQHPVYDRFQLNLQDHFVMRPTLACS
jgi:hypothetical protein